MEGLLWNCYYFSKWNLTMLRLLALQMCVCVYVCVWVCVRRRQVALSSLKWACHRGTDVEREEGEGGKSEGWHLSKMKATLCLFFPFEAKVITFPQLITEHSVLWLTLFSCSADPEGEIKAKIQRNWKTRKRKRGNVTAGCCWLPFFGDCCSCRINGIYCTSHIVCCRYTRYLNQVRSLCTVAPGFFFEFCRASIQICWLPQIIKVKVKHRYHWNIPSMPGFLFQNDCFNQHSRGEAPSSSDCAAHFLWQYLTLQTARPISGSEPLFAFTADQYSHKFTEQETQVSGIVTNWNAPRGCRSPCEWSVWLQLTDQGW